MSLILLGSTDLPGPPAHAPSDAQELLFGGAGTVSGVELPTCLISAGLVPVQLTGEGSAWPAPV